MVTKVMAALGVLIAAIGVGHQGFAGAPAGPQTFKVVVGGETFVLEEVDIGARLGCTPDAHVAVVLKDGKGYARWSFYLRDTASFLAFNGCISEVSKASVVGVAVPRDDLALWVIQVLSCGGSCYGYDVHVFAFDPAHKSFDSKTGEYDSSTVYEEIQQKLGRGGIEFEFPRLVLYVNNGYKECPSHWTRMIYEWTDIAGWVPEFILKNAVSYSSPHCNPDPRRHWPPDPGQ